MKQLKMLGLAVVAAAALTAFVGAGTASAETTLCEGAGGSGCLAAGATIKAKLKSGTEAKLTGSFPVNCTGSSIEDKIGTATTPSGSVEAKNLTWSGCNAETVSTVTGGTMQIHHDVNNNGTLTIKGFVVHIKKFGFDCYYGGEITGTLTAGTPAIIDITTNVTRSDVHPSDAFGCPLNAEWHAEYEVTSPKSLAVVTGV